MPVAQRLLHLVGGQIWRDKDEDSSDGASELLRL